MRSCFALQAVAPLTAALLLGCGHIGVPSTAATAERAPSSAFSASDAEPVVGMVEGLELAGREDLLFRQGRLSSNLIVLDDRQRRRFLHSEELPAVGGRLLQLGDLVSFTPPKPESDELSRLTGFRFLNAEGTAPDARLLSAFYSFVPQYLKVMPPGFFKPVPARSGLPSIRAVVVGLALAAREETLSNGEGLVSNLVVLALDSPTGPGRVLTTYSYALPAIGTRRVSLGDVLSFVPADGDDGGNFDQLAGLRFQE